MKDPRVYRMAVSAVVPTGQVSYVTDSIGRREHPKVSAYCTPICSAECYLYPFTTKDLVLDASFKGARVHHPFTDTVPHMDHPFVITQFFERRKPIDLFSSMLMIIGSPWSCIDPKIFYTGTALVSFHSDTA